VCAIGPVDPVLHFPRQRIAATHEVTPLKCIKTVKMIKNHRRVSAPVAQRQTSAFRADAILLHIPWSQNPPMLQNMDRLRKPRGPEGGQAIQLLLTRFCSSQAFFVWYQGESDSTPERKIYYQSRVTHFLNRVRALCPTVRIIVVQLASVDARYAANLNWDFDYIRRIQAQIPNVALVETIDLTRQEPDHLSSRSLITLGERIGARIVGWAQTTRH
jgi:hypothetical protein